MEDRVAPAHRILRSSKARQMIKSFFLLISAIIILAAQPSLMPWPVKLTPGDGELVIDQTFRVAITGHADSRVHASVDRLMAHLARETGMPLGASTSKEPALVVQCDGAGAPIQKLGEDESYRLEVTSRQAKL